MNFPLAIGGVGGSGTRVVAGVLARMNIFLGADLNDALDNLAFTLLFKRASLWPVESHGDEIEKLLQLFTRIMTSGSSPDDAELALLRRCLDECTDEHPAEWRSERHRCILKRSNWCRDGQWGWKEPNTHIVLPVLLQQLPALRYIHVMRHGVDMAFSANQNQLRLWGSRLCGRDIDPGNPADALAYWCAVHRRLQETAARFPGRILLLNFDALCSSPEQELKRLLEFMGSGQEPASFSSGIKLPESSGRYRSADLSVFDPDDLECVRELGFHLD